MMAQIETIVEEELSPPPLHDNERLTWMNNWSDSLWQLKREMPIKIRLSTEIAEAIVNRGYEGAWSPLLESLQNEISGHLKHRGMFVRTNRRSPKDYTEGKSLYGEEKIVDALCSSMRVVDDLCYLMMHKQSIYLYLFNYYPEIQERELRCFVKNHKLIGITQYEGTKIKGFPEDDPEAYISRCKYLFKLIEPRVNLDSFVFDCWMSGSGDNLKANFLEINPYGMSDPCFFKSYDEIEERGGFAYQKTTILDF
ncbi:MAG: hypothetical protein KDD35_12770 [Bdellovibrionales bacterium]|nr:hypothetical protein [Bdellovibrionales bacterium]